MSWTRSSFCGNAACIDVCRQDRIVLVRDSTGTVQAWSPREWDELLDDIRTDLARPNGVTLYFDGYVELGLDHHDDKLLFTASEWEAFKKGVEKGEFEIDKLREFKELSSPAAETGMSPAPGRTVGPVAGQTFSRMGARRGHDPTSSITVSCDLPEDQANHAAAGADITGRDTSAPAAAPFTNLQRVHTIVLTQIRLGGLKSEIAEAIVADLQEGGLIVDDPAVETQETGS